MVEINMKKYSKTMVLILFSAILFSCNKIGSPHTPHTERLINELLVKLDSTDVYAARKEREIEAYKAKLVECQGDPYKNFESLYEIGEKYATYSIDSTLVYLDKASKVAEAIGCNSLRLKTQVRKASILTSGGFYVEAQGILSSLPRASFRGEPLTMYYSTWALLYHELYASYYIPEQFEAEYRQKYTQYRDSLLMVADTASVLYLRNMERKEARAGNFAEARRYNEIRRQKLGSQEGAAYATFLYDRYFLAAHYEGNLTGEAVDDLLRSAIIEVEASNYDIASLLRVESYLHDNNKVTEAKKVSDHYYSSLRFLGSRKRLIDGGELAITIANSSFNDIMKKNRSLMIFIIFISVLAIALIFTLYIIRKYLRRISKLNKQLKRTGKISRRYVGVIFQLYSSYIKRLEAFSMKIRTNVKRGDIDHVLELTKMSGDSSSEERRMLFHNFDSAFVDIFPDFIQTVNSCLKSDSQITPKKTEILNNELRILALNKLGIEDNKEIADMLMCSIKTVYNLRSTFKARLAISEKAFNRVIFKM